jgi:hypothetical protein
MWRQNGFERRFLLSKRRIPTSVSVRPPLAVGILISGYWYKCSGNLTNRLLKRWPPCAAVIYFFCPTCHDFYLPLH